MNRGKILVSLIVLVLIAAAVFAFNPSDKQEPPNISEPDNKQFIEQEITLYFGDSQAMFLVPEKRIIEIEKDSPIADAVVTELITGPQNKDLSPTIPQGTRLLSLKIEDRVAYLDFNKEFRENHPGGSSGETMTLISIVNSLTELDSIDEIQILIEGEIYETLAGHWDISKPITRDEKIIQKQ